MKYYSLPKKLEDIVEAIKAEGFKIISDSSYHEWKDPTAASVSWRIESPKAYGTCRGTGISLTDEIGTSDAYRGDCLEPS